MDTISTFGVRHIEQVLHNFLLIISQQLSNLLLRLISMTREDTKQKIEALGGKVVSSVSKNTNFVIVGAEAGSKKEKAQTLGILLLDEQKFLTMLQSE